MADQLKKSGKFTYLDKGEGTPIITLHGLMGGLSNFDAICDFFPKKGYRVIILELPLYSLSLIKTNVKTYAKYVASFIEHMEFKEKEVVLLGNSLGGHIGLLCTSLYPELVKGLVLTGSSGLYESSMGESYPKRGDYEYIKKKAQEVFFDPEVATKELVDDVFATVNDRTKLIRTLAIAKSAIRHNMAKDLPNMLTPTCIIWGENDAVTPPKVGEEFNKLLPDSDLYWIEKCGHAAMMEHPDEFNRLLFNWLQKRKF